MAPEIKQASDAENVSYNVLPTLVPLLRREARLVKESGDDYPHRIIAGGDFAVTMLTRNEVNDRLPRHLIWLDATASPRLYTTCFKRPVEVVDARPSLKGRVFQVHSRLNGKSGLLTMKGELTEKATQLEAMIDRIIADGGYERPAIISFQGFVNGSEKLRHLDKSHFYAARGTNTLEGCDAIIIAGAPMPPRNALLRMATMLFFERDAPFATEWTTRVLPYRGVEKGGKGLGYPVASYWLDDDMRSLLESFRESEIVQAAHRVRPIFRSVDVWLLTNIPLDELPPTNVYSLAELFDAPKGVNVFKWADVLDAAKLIDREIGSVTAQTLAHVADVSDRTALRYMRILKQTGEWEPSEDHITQYSGRIPEAITRLHDKAKHT